MRESLGHPRSAVARARTSHGRVVGVGASATPDGRRPWPVCWGRAPAASVRLGLMQAGVDADRAGREHTDDVSVLWLANGRELLLSLVIRLPHVGGASCTPSPSSRAQGQMRGSHALTGCGLVEDGSDVRPPPRSHDRENASSSCGASLQHDTVPKQGPAAWEDTWVEESVVSKSGRPSGRGGTLSRVLEAGVLGSIVSPRAGPPNGREGTRSHATSLRTTGAFLGAAVARDPSAFQARSTAATSLGRMTCVIWLANSSPAHSSLKRASSHLPARAACTSSRRPSPEIWASRVIHSTSSVDISLVPKA